MAIDITALYCCLDDFCKVFEDWEAHRLIPSETTRQRAGKLSRAEMLFIMVLFHLAPFKHFKAFYRYGSQIPSFLLALASHDLGGLCSCSGSCWVGAWMWARRSSRANGLRMFAGSLAVCMGLTCTPNGWMRWQVLRLG